MQGLEQRSIIIEAEAAQIDRTTPHGQDQMALYSALETSRIHNAPVNISRGPSDEYILTVDLTNKQPTPQVTTQEISTPTKEVYAQAGRIIAHQAVGIMNDLLEAHKKVAPHGLIDIFVADKSSK